MNFPSQFMEEPKKCIKGQVSKETVVLRWWEYYKIIWFCQLS